MILGVLGYRASHGQEDRQRKTDIIVISCCCYSDVRRADEARQDLAQRPLNSMLASDGRGSRIIKFQKEAEALNFLAATI